jgi:serine/threonine-protein kinase
MAPEQRAGLADLRADVYALGAILRDLVGAAEAGSRVARPLASIVARAMESDPDTRYPTVATLAADVRRFVDGDAVTAHRETLLDRAQRLAWIYRTPIGLVLAYLAMRILLLLWRG